MCLLTGDERNVSELKEIASVTRNRDMVKPGWNISVERVTLLGNTDDRSVHVNVRSSLALRRVINPIKPDTRASRGNRGQIDGRDRRDPGAARPNAADTPPPSAGPNKTARRGSLGTLRPAPPSPLTTASLLT